MPHFASMMNRIDMGNLKLRLVRELHRRHEIATQLPQGIAISPFAH
jgi:hypothetical protein